MQSDIVSYYKARAGEYEKIYSKPERQTDLQSAAHILQDIFAGKEVIEIACGTGYWTQRIAFTAKSILATDINEEVIAIARSKEYAPAAVSFQMADLFAMPGIKKESLFGGFIWSHIKIQELNNFLDSVNNLVTDGGTVVLMDNNYVEGSNLPVADTDEYGNTFQIRVLENGTTHKVLKNFPTELFILQFLAGKATGIEFINLQYFWILKYTMH